MEGAGILHAHLVYFMAIWYILWPFGIFYGYLVYIFPILVCCTKKNLAIRIRSCFATNICMHATRKVHLTAMLIEDDI
jgi:hypothetical protein